MNCAVEINAKERGGRHRQHGENRADGVARRISMAKESGLPPGLEHVVEADDVAFQDPLPAALAGNPADLKTLADRLSDHARTGNVLTKPPGRSTSSSKGSGVAK